MTIDFVSRAGQKLAHAITTFGVKVNGKLCADFGCSTGGFTDCLLQNGAVKVYAVDTAYGVLEWKLRNDTRVVVLERTNALHVELPEPVDVIAIDVGWTKQKLIVPNALTLLKPDGCIISLMKPHYEAEPAWRQAGKVKEEFLPNVIAKVKSELAAIGAVVEQMTESPIVGSKGGNKEYLLLIRG
ncbi:TlyA family rRNA (cytidine-2'-O)-methyltransferase [Candidatus Uhrbacteria bacterium CG10_big_fil_rev_8_21_14_0_10_48_11]|uniref:TlyA family rRNA (Cytidine-2'-O)-methyltransferase n=1 Tax=Candidatus Uhrbacteria bacterium CG10_big_fil_rev_8_21_14_0_10_48_11 TaxID=1975037 RepID=A0A2M8LFI0_9BACT|nr:MAG: TlyA family rRNA (cytidine-2'-O)-methyltransferase [Candidatus Uhrbacteria bacterium CG10_big_fil_rev_8_21_14_0_10_48_11]